LQGKEEELKGIIHPRDRPAGVFRLTGCKAELDGAFGEKRGKNSVHLSMNRGPRLQTSFSPLSRRGGEGERTRVYKGRGRLLYRAKGGGSERERGGGEKGRGLLRLREGKKVLGGGGGGAAGGNRLLFDGQKGGARPLAKEGGRSMLRSEAEQKVGDHSREKIEFPLTLTQPRLEGEKKRHLGSDSARERANSGTFADWRKDVLSGARAGKT